MAKRIFPKELFNAMHYKVHSVKNLENVDRLAAIPGFFDIDVPHPEQTRKYLVYLYDRRSPFVKEITNLSERKEMAAVQAGFNLSDTSQKEYVQSLYSMQSDKALEMTMMLLKAQQDKLWQVIVAKEQYFEECVKGLLTPIDKDKTTNAKQHIDAILVKSKLREEIDLLQNSLQGDYNAFYGDEEADLRRLLSERNSVSSENIAKMRKD